MRGFSYYELLISVVLIAVASLIINGWSRHFYKQNNKIINYYHQREYLLNKAALLEGEQVMTTQNLSIKKIATGNLVLEYGVYNP